MYINYISLKLHYYFNNKSIIKIKNIILYFIFGKTFFLFFILKYFRKKIFSRSPFLAHFSSLSVSEHHFEIM